LSEDVGPVNISGPIQDVIHDEDQLQSFVKTGNAPTPEIVDDLATVRIKSIQLVTLLT
jgi:hypothetical protein